MNLIIYTDGGSRSNPGFAAASYVIFKNDKIVAEKGIYLGVKTNNEAEYLAIFFALEEIVNNFNISESHILIRCDSLLVVSQLQGKWKLKDQKLKGIHAEIKAMEKKVKDIKYEHIPREWNSRADLLVNLTLDENISL